MWIAHTMFALPLAIFLLHNFVVEIPAAIIEAARVDGAGHGQIFFRIVLPLTMPASASFAIFQFLWVWIAEGRTAESVRKTFGNRVQAVALDFADRSTWAAAFDGVDRMFLLWPPNLANPKRQLISLLEFARDRGVAQVVFLSVQGVETNKVAPHGAIEAWLRTSGLAWTFVRSSFLHQNFSTAHLTDICDHDILIVPAGGGATAFVDAEDVGAVAVAALLDPETYTTSALTVTGDQILTYDQIAQVLTAELERPIRYARPGIFQYLRHARRALAMPWSKVLVNEAIYGVVRLGLTASRTDTVREVLGRDPIRFEQFAHRERDLWHPGPRFTERNPFH